MLFMYNLSGGTFAFPLAGKTQRLQHTLLRHLGKVLSVCGMNVGITRLQRSDSVVIGSPGVGLEETCCWVVPKGVSCYLTQRVS